MWLILGIIAIGGTFTNLYMYKIGRGHKVAMAIGLSFTGLALVASYSMVADWVKKEDWSALLDVVPTMSIALWILTLISIILNIIPIFLEIRDKE